MRYHVEIHANPLQVAHRFNVVGDAFKPDRKRIETGEWGNVLRDAVGRRPELMRWGVRLERMGTGSEFTPHVRIEELAGRAQRHLLGRRLFVFASAIGVHGGGKSWVVTASDSGLFALAGIWDVDGNWHGRPVRAFRLITGPADERFEGITDRLPVILRPENERAWMDPFGQESALLDALEPMEVVVAGS